MLTTFIITNNDLPDDILNRETLSCIYDISTNYSTWVSDSFAKIRKDLAYKLQGVQTASLQSTVLVLIEGVHACLKMNSRLREHPLESRQRKSPLSLQGGVFFKGCKCSQYSILIDTLKQQGGNNVSFSVPYPLQGGARAGERGYISSLSLVLAKRGTKNVSKGFKY